MGTGFTWQHTFLGATKVTATSTMSVGSVLVPVLMSTGGLTMIVTIVVVVVIIVLRRVISLDVGRKRVRHAVLNEILCD